MRRFYAPPEQFQANNVSLGLEETRHLRDVLRLKETEKMQIFDGAGREFSGVIRKHRKKGNARRNSSMKSRRPRPNQL